jgi:hypothetical protein
MNLQLKEKLLFLDSKNARINPQDQFYWTISPPIEHTTSIELISAAIPWVWSNLHSENNTLAYIVDDGSPILATHVVQLTEGNYDDPANLCAEIRRVLKLYTAITGDYMVTFNEINAKISIMPTGSLFNTPNRLILKFNESTCASVIGLTSDTICLVNTLTELQNNINTLTIPNLEIRLPDGLIHSYEAGSDKNDASMTICDVCSMSGFSSYDVVNSSTFSGVAHATLKSTLPSITVEITDNAGWTPYELYRSNIKFSFCFKLKGYFKR